MKYSILDVHLAFFLLKYDKSNPNWIKPHWNCHKYQMVYTPISLRKDFPHNQHLISRIKSVLVFYGRL